MCCVSLHLCIFTTLFAASYCPMWLLECLRDIRELTTSESKSGRASCVFTCVDCMCFVSLLLCIFKYLHHCEILSYVTIRVPTGYTRAHHIRITPRKIFPVCFIVLIACGMWVCWSEPMIVISTATYVSYVTIRVSMSYLRAPHIGIKQRWRAAPS